MNILGIETSCDETGAAVVQNGIFLRSNIVASSLNEHKKYGGIIPEIASRRQMEVIRFVVDEALEKAGVPLDDIDAVAVTVKPGLIGSLLVGISFARSLSYAAKKPLVEVDHIKAHLYANFLVEPTNKSKTPPKLPAVGLVVSGGHSSLFYVKNFRSFRLLGQTRDDAAGETFDKVARILELGYPGGPVIDRLSKTGENKDIRFTCAEIPGTLDFSFSGIKTAVLYHVRQYKEKKDIPVNRIAYAFQNSVVSVLTDKCLAACKKTKAKTLLIGGGVAANSSLREHLQSECQKHGINVFFPPLPLCLDNAAMIAGLGYHLLTNINKISQKGETI